MKASHFGTHYLNCLLSLLENNLRRRRIFGHMMKIGLYVGEKLRFFLAKLRNYIEKFCQSVYYSTSLSTLPIAIVLPGKKANFL